MTTRKTFKCLAPTCNIFTMMELVKLETIYTITMTFKRCQIRLSCRILNDHFTIIAVRRPHCLTTCWKKRRKKTILTSTDWPMTEVLKASTEEFTFNGFFKSSQQPNKKSGISNYPRQMCCGNAKTYLSPRLGS